MLWNTVAKQKIIRLVLDIVKAVLSIIKELQERYGYYWTNIEHIEVQVLTDTVQVRSHGQFR